MSRQNLIYCKCLFHVPHCFPLEVVKRRIYESFLFLINVYLRYIQKKTLNRPHFVLLAARNACFQKQK